MYLLFPSVSHQHYYVLLFTVLVSVSKQQNTVFCIRLCSLLTVCTGVVHNFGMN